MRGYEHANGHGARPSDRYLTDRVATASPAELIGMLLDAGVKALHAATIPTVDASTFSRHLLRAQDVVMELRCSLNHEAGEMAANLDALYSFMFTRLVDANIRRDRKLVASCLLLLQPLQEAWHEACTSRVAVAAS